MNPPRTLIIRNLLIACCAECSKCNEYSGSLHLITPKTLAFTHGSHAGWCGGEQADRGCVPREESGPRLVRKLERKLPRMVRKIKTSRPGPMRGWWRVTDDAKSRRAAFHFKINRRAEGLGLVLTSGIVLSRLPKSHALKRQRGSSSSACRPGAGAAGWVPQSQGAQPVD